MKMRMNLKMRNPRQSQCNNNNKFRNSNSNNRSPNSSKANQLSKTSSSKRKTSLKLASKNRNPSQPLLTVTLTKTMTMMMLMICWQTMMTMKRMTAKTKKWTWRSLWRISRESLPTRVAALTKAAFSLLRRNPTRALLCSSKTNRKADSKTTSLNRPSSQANLQDFLSKSLSKTSRNLKTKTRIRVDKTSTRGERIRTKTRVATSSD